jgi:hypothetical protein
MGNRSWLHPLTGVIFILVVIVGFAVSGEEPPDATEDSIQSVVDFYVDNEDQQMIGGILEGLAGALLIFFGGYLFKRLRASGAEASAVVTLAGTVALALGLAIDGTITLALSELANGDTPAEPGAVQALSSLWNNDYLPLALGMFVFLWGFGVAIVRHGALPRWMGWVAVAAGITAISPAFPVAAIVAALLILVSSVMFSREEKAGTTA